MNYCHAGHKIHNRKKVDSILGDMLIYDWVQYMDFKGYCTGQDGVSETIEKSHSWDIKIHELLKLILESGDSKKLFFDVGAHIGYFSRLASQLGYKTVAFDGDKENLELLALNSPTTEFNLVWFEQGMNKYDGYDVSVELMKIDIEGSEVHAVEYFKTLFEKKRVNNIIMEVSPVFNTSYPDLVSKMVHVYGFKVLELDGNLFDFDYNFAQKDLWFKKI